MKFSFPVFLATTTLALAAIAPAYGYDAPSGQANGPGAYANPPQGAMDYAVNGGYGGDQGSGKKEGNDGKGGGDKQDGYGDSGGQHDGSGAPGTRQRSSAHFAVLSGGNEVSAEGKANVGDQDGSGAASVIVDLGAQTLCFSVLVNGIDTPVAAHIHRAEAGRNGPIVVPLTAPASGQPGASSGCVTRVDAKLLKAIKDKPWAYYVNVHTGLFPDGALRGQLF